MTMKLKLQIYLENQVNFNLISFMIHDKIEKKPFTVFVENLLLST